MTNCKQTTAHDPALEAVQRRSQCNQDDEPEDWGVPCCGFCMCAQELAAMPKEAGHG